MSFKIIGTAFNLPLSVSDKLVFLVLCEYANDDTRTCYPSYATIQKKASLANSSLRTALLVLEAVGLISIKIRSTKRGGRTSTLYKISEFDVKKFDVKHYKQVAKGIRAVRNFREKKDSQSPKIDTANKYPNLRKSTQIEYDLQSPEIDTVLDTQPLEFTEKPLASSFQPLALEEEECVGDIVSSIVIPPLLENLTKEDVISAVKELVRRKRPFDPSIYEARLFAQVESGDHRTCQNILSIVSDITKTHEKPWENEKRLKREQGMEFITRLQEHGYSNYLDYLTKKGD